MGDVNICFLVGSRINVPPMKLAKKQTGVPTTKSDKLLLSRNKYRARKINIKVGKYTLGSERTKDTNFSL